MLKLDSDMQSACLALLKSHPAGTRFKLQTARRDQQSCAFSRCAHTTVCRGMRGFHAFPRMYVMASPHSARGTSLFSVFPLAMHPSELS